MHSYLKHSVYREAQEWKHIESTEFVQPVFAQLTVCVSNRSPFSRLFHLLIRMSLSIIAENMKEIAENMKETNIINNINSCLCHSLRFNQWSMNNVFLWLGEGGRHKYLNNFDKGQIVMARCLDVSISEWEGMWCAFGLLSSSQYLVTRSRADMVMKIAIPENTYTHCWR